MNEEGTAHRELLSRRWKGDKRQKQRVSDGHSAPGTNEETSS